MIRITPDTLNPQEVTELVRKPSNGAVVTFLGTTRDLFEGRDVDHLEYEAYQPMAENMLQQIVDEIRERWVDRGRGHRASRGPGGRRRDQPGGGDWIAASQGGA